MKKTALLLAINVILLCFPSFSDAGFRGYPDRGGFDRYREFDSRFERNRSGRFNGNFGRNFNSQSGRYLAGWPERNRSGRFNGNFGRDLRGGSGRSDYNDRSRPFIQNW